jgi:hypothetical protein
MTRTLFFAVAVLSLAGCLDAVSVDPDAGSVAPDAGGFAPDTGGLAPDTGVCTPQCQDKKCGDDGCGGKCGTCTDGQQCVAGACVTPTCDPACGGETPVCNASQVCECDASSCTGGKQCVAGACATPECTPACGGETPVCNASQVCECDASSCTGGKPCVAGVCVPPTCTPACGGETPVCNASLVCECDASSCTGGKQCVAGACVPAPTCTPACGGETPVCNASQVCECDATSCTGGKQCVAGACVPAPTCTPACGGETPVCNANHVCECSPTSCTGGKLCVDGACKPQGTCTPACAGETPYCNPATTSCQCISTSCAAGKVCNPTTSLCEACVPQCAGHECGGDGCGGTCGACGAGLACDTAYRCAPANDSCAGATSLTFTGGQAVVAGSTKAASHTTEGTCTGSYSGAGDVVYSFHLAAAQSVKITVATTDPAYTPGVFVRKVCDSTNSLDELGCEPQVSVGSTVQLNLLSVAAGDYFVWVTGDGGTVGDYTLTVKIDAPILPPANDTCAAPTALPLVKGTPYGVTASTVGADNTTSGLCVGSTGPDRVYKFTITEPLYFEAELDTGGAWEGGLYLRSDCANEDSAYELACKEGQGKSRIQLANLPAGTYWLWVDGYLGASGDFSLAVTVRDLLPPPANDTCAGATELPFTNGKASVTGTLLAATATTAGSCGGSSTPDVVYKVTTTSPKSLTAKMTPLTAFYATLYVRKVCDSTASQDELGCDAPYSGPAQVALSTLPAGTYFIWVDGDLSQFGDYQLDVTLGDVVPPPANDTCSAPQVLDLASGSATAQGNLQYAVNDTVSAVCGGMNSPDVVYQFTTSAPKSLAVAVTTTDSAFQPVVYLRKVCDGAAAADELSCNDATTTSAAFALPNLPAGTYWIWVDGLYGTFGAFDLSVTAGPPVLPPANDLCSGAQEIFANQPVTASTASAKNDYGNGTFSAACSLGYSYVLDGLDSVFLFKPATSGLYVVAASPDPGYDVAVWVTAGTCAGDGSACLAVADANPAGSPDSLAFSAVAGTSYFIVVDSMWAAGGGGFTLVVK